MISITNGLEPQYLLLQQVFHSAIMTDEIAEGSPLDLRAGEVQPPGAGVTLDHPLRRHHLAHVALPVLRRSVEEETDGGVGRRGEEERQFHLPVQGQDSVGSA